MRRDLGLRSQVDAEVVANHLGLDVCTWPFEVLQEMRVENVIGVARRLDASRRGRVMAHAIGHSLPHPGNHLWMQDHTLPGHRVQREAGEFAPTGPSTAIHTRDGGRAGRRHPGVRPVLGRTGGVRSTSTSTSSRAGSPVKRRPWRTWRRASPPAGLPALSSREVSNTRNLIQPRVCGGPRTQAGDVRVRNPEGPSCLS